MSLGSVDGLAPEQLSWGLGLCTTSGRPFLLVKMEEAG